MNIHLRKLSNIVIFSMKNPPATARGFFMSEIFTILGSGP